ncbi:isochorismatase [Thermoplasma volcanium GSS1]|uniref:Isochorismatase n=1 Tax=Thermoplasma volcanium (strain ATCC 51530 / DSM 4299 / JCM 9571 / NBRC 15438 / GSS1) TaxID=273116 RepID=Q97AM6_THEVO|nr:isochorismatase family cysteine hydrolase [Thermoplasma volcanium]BAB59926.1 isochorismatase [Thermoplasma volcanium GSS1]
MTKGLVVIDMLNDFVHGTLKTQESLSTVIPARNVLEAFRKKGLPIFFTNDAHYKEDPEMKIWGSHAMKGSWGAQIIEELKPLESEFVIEKHAYSAFYGTNLDQILRARGVTELFLIGLDADICVRHTAADALYRNYAITVVEDAVAARIDKNWKDYFIRVYGANIVKSDEINKVI